MDDLKKVYSLNRQALIYDFVCIIIAGAVLYLANAQMLPFGALVAGSLLALVALVMAIIKMFSARRLARRLESQNFVEQSENSSDESDSSDSSAQSPLDNTSD